MTKTGKRIFVICSSVLSLIIVATMVFFLLNATPAVATSIQDTNELKALFSDKEVKTITIDRNYFITETLYVEGEKEIVGNGAIVMHSKSKQPDNAELFTPGSISKYGCAELVALDTSTQLNMIVLNPGASLTLKGSVKLDGSKVANNVFVSKDAALTISEDAVLRNPYYCNITNDGTLTVSGGRISKSPGNNIINLADMTVEDGTITGAEEGAVIFNSGTLSVSGGIIGPSSAHGIYVENGASLNLTGGAVLGAKMDNVHICEGGSADLSGGTVTGALLHGIHNNGQCKAGEIRVTDAGIINDPSGTMELAGTKISENDTQAICNNGGKLTVTNVTVRNSFNNVVLNTGDGTTEVTGLVVDVVGDHAIVNSAGSVMKMTDVDITGVGHDKCAVRNYGELEITDIYVKDATHSFYNEGVLRLNNAEIEDTVSNVIYNRGGKVYAQKVNATDTGQYGISNAMNGHVELRDSSFDVVGKNGFHNVGTAYVENIVLKNVSQYGISNPSGSAFNGKNIRIINAGRDHSGIHDRGQMKVEDVYIENVKTGIYIGGRDKGAPASDGIVSIKNIVIKNTTDNGIYNNGGNLTVEGASITNIGGYGITTSGTINLKDISIDNAGKTGIYNSGSMSFKNVDIRRISQYGLSNPSGTITGDGLSISFVGRDKSGIHNRGSINVTNLTIQGAVHGIYNQGSVLGSGFTIKDSTGNGIYNNGGLVDVKELKIDNVGEYGISNSGDARLQDSEISNTGRTGLYNSGKLSVKNVKVSLTGEYGISNPASGTITGENLSVSFAGKEKAAVHNRGSINISGFTAEGAVHGIYNEGTVSGKDYKIKDMANNGIYNNGGTVEINGLNISNVGQYGISNSGKAKLQRVDIDVTGKTGIFNSGTFEVTALTIKNTGEYGISNPPDGVFIGNDINISGVAMDKSGIHNRGRLEVTDISITGATHGIYNEGEITGTWVSVYLQHQNGIYNAKGTVTINGYRAEDAGNCGISNTGNMTLTKAVILNSTGSAISNDGNLAIDGLEIDKASQYGITNRAGATIEVSNASIKNVVYGRNSIHNLGKATVTDSVIEGSTNGIYNEKTLKISNITIKSPGNTGVNNNKGTVEAQNVTIMDSGMQAFSNSGTVTGEGPIILIDAGMTALHNPAGSFDIDGDIIIENVAGNGHGIYNAGSLSASSITVKNAEQNGIYNYGGRVAVSGSITVDGSIYGISNPANSTFTAGAVTVSNTSNSGIHNRGTFTVTGDVTIDKAANHGINLGGNMKVAGNMVIKNVTNHGIVINGGSNDNVDNSSLIMGADEENITGSILIYSDADESNVVHGIYNNASGVKIIANEISINDTKNTGLRFAGGNGLLEVKTKLTIEKVTASSQYGFTINSTNSTAKVRDMEIKDINGTALYTRGTLIATGNVSIADAASNGVDLGGIMKVYGNLNIANVANHGVYFSVANSSLIMGEDEDNITGDITITSNPESPSIVHGIYNNAGNIKIVANNITINGANNTALRFAGGNGVLEAKGKVTIENMVTSGQYGFTLNSSNSTVKVRDMEIKKISGTALYTRGTLIATGNVSISDTTNHGVDLASVMKVYGNLNISNVTNHGIYFSVANSSLIMGEDEDNITGNIIITSNPQSPSIVHGIYNNNVSGIYIFVNDITINGTKNTALRFVGGNGAVVAKGKITIENVVTSGQYGITVNNSTGQLMARDIAIKNVNGVAIHNAGTTAITGELVLENITGNIFGTNSKLTLGTAIRTSKAINFSGTITNTEAGSVEVAWIGDVGSGKTIAQCGNATLFNQCMNIFRPADGFVLQQNGTTATNIDIVPAA